jgi:hypothetical protein
MPRMIGEANSLRSRRRAAAALTAVMKRLVLVVWYTKRGPSGALPRVTGYTARAPERTQGGDARNGTLRPRICTLPAQRLSCTMQTAGP